MSSIEEKFFETFEIKPKYKFKGCENGITFYTYGCDIPSCKGCPKEIKEKIYPQITDRILLKLICIANHEDVYIELEGTDVETMKNNLLENFIHFKRIIPKEQIQALFKE